MPTQKKPDLDQVSFLVGVDWREGPPVPIPNTEVKLVIAENTCRATGRENRECRHKKAAHRRQLPIRKHREERENGIASAVPFSHFSIDAVTFDISKAPIPL